MSPSLNPAVELPATNLHPLATAALWCGTVGPISSDQELLCKPGAPQDRSHLGIHVHHLSFLGAEGWLQGWGPGYVAQGTPATQPDDAGSESRGTAWPKTLRNTYNDQAAGFKPSCEATMDVLLLPSPQCDAWVWLPFPPLFAPSLVYMAPLLPPTTPSTKAYPQNHRGCC